MHSSAAMSASWSMSIRTTRRHSALPPSGTQLRAGGGAVEGRQQQLARQRPRRLPQAPAPKGQHIKFGVVHAKDPGFGTDLVACSNGANWPNNAQSPGE